MNNFDLITNRIQYILLEDNLNWEEVARRAGEHGSNVREELMEKLDDASELLSLMGYHIEIVRNSERIR
ncbi:hypothetical protein AAHN97_19240 [Chitinophaga niabensis]|uniref:hypothetical protein n=1 Tax=Chitinophaga niabensis TaxID=536979 RepID=UPI0031BB6274